MPSPFRSRLALPAALVAASLYATAATAAAQARPDSTRQDSTPRRIEPVVVRGVRAPAVVGAAGAVVADVDSLRLPAAPLLEQALRELPFVLVRRNSRGETELSVRGSDSRQAAVLVDGVPITLGWDHRADVSVVPLTGVQRLTLVRGVSSLLHGPNVLGGVVEVGLGQGPAGPGAPYSAVVMADVDQHGGAGVSLSGATALDTRGRVSVRGGVGYRDRPGFALSQDVADLGGRRTLRVNSDLRHQDAFASLHWQAPAGAFARVSVSGMRAERGVPPELHLESPRLWRYPEQRRVLATATAGTGARTTPWGHGSVRASVGVNEGRTDIESFATAAYDRVVGTESGRERMLTTRVLGEHTLGAATLRAAATVAEVRYDEALDAAPAARYRQRLWSAGSEVTLPVRAGVQLGGGLVLDGADTPETGGREALGRLTRAGARVALTAEAPADVRLHLSASRRARFPALRELYSGALHRFVPNPALAPETLLGVEAGATKTWARAELQGVAYQHRLRDAVVRTTTADRRFRRENRDEIRSAGLELLGAWRAASGVALHGDLATQRVRVLDPAAGAERHAEHQPELRAGVDLGLPLAFGARAHLGVRHTGRQYCTNPDLRRQVALDAQSSGDLLLERGWSVGRGAARLFRTLRLALALDNVTDAAVYDQCGLPQPGRTVRVTFELR